MKLSETWLREWVNPLLTGEQLAEQLTMAGLEIDGRYPVAGVFSQVVVARVRQTTPHPQANKLTLCEVEAAGGTLYQIVCGAANVRTGLTVALALPGASLPGGIHIQETQLRGHLSQGMLCSSTELGLEERSEGILELPEDAPIGVDLRDYLQLDDHVLEVNLTPNRADCFSVAGIAREVAALNRQPVQPPEITAVVPETDASMVVEVRDEAACPLYCTRVIRGISLMASTPLWMKERLRRAGVRAKHPIVDVTNYVMLELGQPMHAFDLQHIKGAIVVRRAVAGETLELLDGQEVTLNEKALVIADEQNVLALAGVMGGAASAVQSETTDIVLESAFFNPKAVAGVARQYGLCTDSSQRFERGVDFSLPVKALERATALIQVIAGGKPGSVVQMQSATQRALPVQIEFYPQQVQQLSGVAIEEAQIQSILHHLGMRVACEPTHWVVEVPTYRFDLTSSVDLVEEVIRLHGYEHLVANPVVVPLRSGTLSAMEQVSRAAALFLCNHGYHESISYSFVDPRLQAEIYPNTQCLSLLNPISQELSQMRAGMWPGLIASMVHNVHRQQVAIRLFEMGVVFELEAEKLHERPCIAALLTGVSGHLNWSEPTRSFDFYDLKGDVQALLAGFNLQEQAQFIPAVHPALHPGKAARIEVNGQFAGWIGVLHPQFMDALDLAEEVMLFELSLEALSAMMPPVRYQAISKYPQIRRDLSLLVDCDVQAAQIKQAVRAAVTTDWLKAFDVFDVYTGEPVPQGKKSLAIALTLQDRTRTLVDTEINAVISAIIKKLDDDFTIILRD